MSADLSPTGTGAELAEQYADAIMATYGTPLRVLTRGDGSHVWDADGNRYLDLLGGIAVNALGHAHPAWVAAVSAQAATLAHTSNFFATKPQIDLATKLLHLADAPKGSRVFFANSGTEANEAAFKIARRTGRPRILALENGFHGRTIGALSMTHKPAIREPFEPMPPGVEFLQAEDIDALRAALGSDVAALILETIQGEAGVMPLSHEYLAAARSLTAEHGALLIIDEVQTGVARSGAWFAHQLHGIQPDVMTLAKGLGGGFPIGAVIAFGEKAATLLTKGMHGSTFGGNALAATAALATLDTIEAEGLLDNVKRLGAYLTDALEALPGVAEVRGAGLLLGVRLESQISADVAAAAIDAGFIVNAPTPDTVRLAPALTLTAAEAQPFVDWLGEYLVSATTKTEGASE